MEVYNRDSTYHYERRGLYRDVDRKVLTGVCAGLGNHFDVKPNWIRLGFIVSFVFIAPVPLIVYVIATILMPKPGDPPRGSGRRRKWYRKFRSWGRNMNESPYDRYQTNYKPRRIQLEDVVAKFDEIERKVRSMEDVVTSKEYTLRQKFRDLKS